MNYWLILIPLLTAFTGWIVIQSAFQLLFRPIAPKKILGLTIQGVIPAQKQQIADKIGTFIAAEVSNLEILEQKISDPKNFNTVRPLVETHIDDFLRNKLKDQMPMIGMFIGDKTVTSLKAIFIQEIETLFPQVMQKFAGDLKNELNIKQMVSLKIANISDQIIEQQLYGSMIKEIRMLSLFGAAIGLLIGLLQLLIILLIN